MKNTRNLLLLLILAGIVIAATLYTRNSGNPMNAWIQKADSSVIEVNAKTPDQALLAFDHFNWKSERLKRQELGEDNSVDPGFGFGAWGDERFLHIVPYAPDDIEVLYATTAATKKLFGLIALSSDEPKQYVGNHLTREQLERIVQAYFVKDEATILRYCK